MTRQVTTRPEKVVASWITTMSSGSPSSAVLTAPIPNRGDSLSRSTETCESEGFKLWVPCKLCSAAARRFDDDVNIAVVCKGRQVQEIWHGVLWCAGNAICAWCWSCAMLFAAARPPRRLGPCAAARFSEWMSAPSCDPPRRCIHRSYRSEGKLRPRGNRHWL